MMSDFLLIHAIENARLDDLDRSMRLASECIRFAVVTTQPIAADLIDKAIQLRIDSQTVMPALMPLIA
jgi:hypothetical protein